MIDTTLEDFVRAKYHLAHTVTDEQIQPLVDLFEDYRDEVEDDDIEIEELPIPKSVYEAGDAIVAGLLHPK